MSRMTAEEVAEQLLSWHAPGVAEWGAFRDAAEVVRDNLIPQWQDTPDRDGWHWCEALEPDAPPQLLHDSHNGFWLRWTVAGWVPLVGRVCPIGERPKGV